MINSLIKHENKNNNSKVLVNSILNDIYLLPKWEMIKEFTLSDRNFLFIRNSLNVKLFRKFSSKNQLEKYSLRTDDNKVLAAMDLKVYKDSVYIINLDINSAFHFDRIAEKMIQVAAEKALYNTTEQEVVINLTSGILVKHKIKKCLMNNEFLPEEEQSNYEKELFGETYTLKITKNSDWNAKIKQFSFLINK
ncbi:hypothetical protein IJ182_07510 [bacterium]|nr:hypothetical protein [bacterium]